MFQSWFLPFLLLKNELKGSIFEVVLKNDLRANKACATKGKASRKGGLRWSSGPNRTEHLQLNRSLL